MRARTYAVLYIWYILPLVTRASRVEMKKDQRRSATDRRQTNRTRTHSFLHKFKSVFEVSAKRKVEHLPPFAEFVNMSTHLLNRGARPLRSEHNAMTISINQCSASWGTKTLKWFCQGFKCFFSPLCRDQQPL